MELRLIAVLTLCLLMGGCYRDTCPAVGEEYPVLASKCKKAGYGFRIQCLRNGDCTGHLFPASNKDDPFKADEWTTIFMERSDGDRELLVQRMMIAADEPLKTNRKDLEKYDTIYDYTGPK